jgi:hypothetical protein
VPGNEAFCDRVLSVIATLLPSEKVLMSPGTHQNAGLKMSAFIDLDRIPVQK